MSTSLYAVGTQVPNQPMVMTNVLASDTPTATSLQMAITAALAAAAAGALFANASEIGGRPVDFSACAGTASDPKAVYLVQFRAQSGPNGSTPAAVMVYVNPATGMTPENLALATAAQTGAVPNTATLLGTVTIDATGNAPGMGVVLSKFAFRSLFALTEQIAIDNHATNTTLNATQQATITTILANFAIADTITLSDPMTIYAVNYLATAGLLTTARAAAILAGQPVPTS